MNIEIANRLVQLRKEHNLSQEALAERLGISRQAVSKWERAEASPDTDNLIMLAKLYGISLDALLLLEETSKEMEEGFKGTPKESSEGTFGETVDPEEAIRRMAAEEEEDTKNSTEEKDQESKKPEEYVHVGLKGVHVKDKDSEVHVSWNGIYVDDKKRNEKVCIGNGKAYVDGEEYDLKDYNHIHELRKKKRKESPLCQFPMALLVSAIYILMGIFLHLWHPGWLIFFAIPLWHSAVEAIVMKSIEAFAYPVLVVLVFLCLGFFAGAWHPGWVLFLTIPFYYWGIHVIKKNRKKKTEKTEV